MSPKEHDKNKWTSYYAARILKAWKTRQTSLGIDKNYFHKIKTDLDEFYDDPLKKSLIEESY